MNSTLGKLAAGFFVGIALALPLLASTWYVDDDNYNPDYVDDSAAYIDAGFDGTTEAKAFGTIQAAIDADTTLAGDTIIVLPGVYDKGGKELTWNSGGSTAGFCRVAPLKNNIVIRSRDGGAKGAAETHIVGQKAATDSGNGAGAIRCFGTRNTWGIQLRGFTLRDGATVTSYSGDSQYSKIQGGAVLVVSGSSEFPMYVLDCVITNCSGSLNVTRNGTICRSLIADNRADGAGDIGDGTQFYSCIFTRNYGSSVSVLGGTSRAVHCTIVGNQTKYAANSKDYLYNSIVSLSHSPYFNEFNGTPANAAANVTETADGNYQTIAPLLDDYRVLDGSAACTAGDGQYTSASMFYGIDKTYTPSDILNKDFFGRQFASDLSGTVVAGAVAETAAPAGGAIAFTGLDWATKRIIVDGKVSCKSNIYAFPTNYPVQWRVAPQLSSGRLFCWSTTSAHGYAHFADTNDVAYLMPPPAADKVETNNLDTVSTTVWLSPDGDDVNGDGSFEHPYQTLEKGVAATASGNRLIYCKRGTYNRGEAYAGSRTNRLFVADGKNARFVAVDGKDATFIEGRASEATASVSARQGCGPDAIAGVYIAGTARVCFHGFTFRNCYTADHGGSEAKGQGAAVRAGASSVSLLDCDIVGCSAGSGVSYNANLIGCRVRDSSTSGTICYGLAFGCEFSGNTCAAASSGTAYNCTYLGDPPMLNNYGCIGVNGDSVPSGASYVGSIFYNYESYAGSGYSIVDPLIVGAADGRVSSRSPAYSCGVKPNATSAVAGANYYKVADRAIDGVPLVLTADGRPMAGAYQRGVDSAVSICAPNGGLSSAPGTSEITPGGSVVLAAGNPGSRPCYGYAVNGVTNLFDETPSRTLTFADVVSAGAMVVEALYAPHWYVNADPAVGSDSNTGFTPNTAKLTLAAACSAEGLADGDTIHAAAGMYATNYAFAAEGQTIPARVVVRSNTTLVADEGPENTFIVGEGATGETDGEGRWNCGAGAVRCVYLKSGATVRGFTLTGGRTRCRDGQHYSSDDSGGGILGASYETCFGENLVISNNASFRGGAARYVTLRKCRIFGNLGYYNGAIGETSDLFSCVADGNVGNDQTYYYHAIADCTFGPGNKTRDGNAVTIPGGAGSGAYVSNTVIRCPAFSVGNYTRTYCASVSGGAAAPEGLFAVGEENLQLDEKLRPVIGRNAAIDQAVGPVAAVPDLGLDVLGGQRVYNGARDCGALEADWRGRYGSDVGRRMEVLSADPAVFEQAGGSVRVPEGASLGGVLRGMAGRSYDVVLAIRVSDGGSAKLNMGEDETTLGAGTHNVRVSIGEGGLAVCVAAASGDVDVLRAKSLLGFVLSFQ